MLRRLTKDQRDDVLRDATIAVGRQAQEAVEHLVAFVRLVHSVCPDVVRGHDRGGKAAAKQLVYDALETAKHLVEKSGLSTVSIFRACPAGEGCLFVEKEKVEEARRKGREEGRRGERGGESEEEAEEERRD